MLGLLVPAAQHVAKRAVAAPAALANRTHSSGTMRAAVYREFKGPIAVENVPLPVTPHDGVVVEVMATGMCRSDWHGWQGHDDDIRVFPHVPGHELAGVVVDAGPAVQNFKRGDRIVVPFILSCGACGECVTHRRPTICEAQVQPGFHLWGSYAQQVALPRADRNFALLPEGVDFNAGASIGCRFSTAYRGVVTRAALQQDEWLCVFGCGGLGLAAVALGKALGAKVAACDVRRSALQRASELGADLVFDAGDDGQLREAVREATGGGAHVALDASGWAAGVGNAVHVLRRGGRMVQAGLPLGAEADPRIPMARVAGWELELLGSHGADGEDLRGLLQLVKDRRVLPSAMVTAELSLSDACASLMAMGETSPDGVHMIVDFDR